MSSKRLFLIAALAGAATFAYALYSQYVLGLAPCALCIWQRYGLGIGIAGAVMAALSPGRAGRVTFGTLAVLGFVFEAGAAIFHTGVERKWWEGLSTCTGGAMPTTYDPAAISAATPVPRCDEISWEFLGLSMANWNIALALGFAALCLLAIVRIRRAVPEDGPRTA